MYPRYGRYGAQGHPGRMAGPLNVRREDAVKFGIICNTGLDGQPGEMSASAARPGLRDD